MAKLTKESKIKMLKDLITIRRFEERTIQMYAAGEFGGYLHPYVGMEAIAAGACAAIEEKDYLVSTHRGHGHCIAKGADLNKMMAELLGKATGYCKGRGGSMHIADTELKMLGANGIVGGGIPISIGAGFGANGVFHEALNMTAIFKLPVVYICENNLYAISMCSLDSVACEDIGKRACAYGIPGYIIEGSDPVEVYNTVKKAAKHARDGKGPSLIEAKTYRFYGHHPNDPAEYRTKEESEYYKKEKDPLINFKKTMIKEKVITKKEIEKMEKNIIEEVENAVDFAHESPEPELAVFLEEVKQI